jgi:hypothetical protein
MSDRVRLNQDCQKQKQEKDFLFPCQFSSFFSEKILFCLSFLSGGNEADSVVDEGETSRTPALDYFFFS